MKKYSFIVFCLLLNIASFATKIEGKISGLGLQNLHLLRLQGMGFTPENKVVVSDNEGNFSFDIHLISDEMLAISDDNQSFYLQLMVSANEAILKIEGEIIDGKVKYNVAEGSLASRFQNVSSLKNILLRRQDGLAKLAPYYEQNSPQTLWMQAEWKNNVQKLDSLQAEIRADKSDLLAYYFEVESKLMAMFQMDETKALGQFYSIDFADVRLYKTGLIRPIIDQQIKILDIFGAKQGLNVQDQQYHKTIDHIIDGLARGEERNTSTVISYLMNGFANDKKNNYVTYLSDKSLSVVSCAIADNELEIKLKHNALLKIGNKMPDIDFAGIEKSPIGKMSEINAKNIILVFWSSDCSHCQEEMPKLIKLYPQLKERGFELITISMDTKPENYLEASKNFKWLSFCDYKNIDSPLVKDYFVYSTPLLLMLDKDLKLIYKNQINISDALSAFIGSVKL